MSNMLTFWFKIIILSTSFISPIAAFCQTNSKLYNFSPPQFGNGDEALVSYFRERINLKPRDFKYQVTGTISIKLTLTHNKEVKNIVVIDSTNSVQFNKEIIDYLWQGKGNWKPAKISGKPVDINIIVSANLLLLDGNTIYYILNSSFVFVRDPLLINGYYNAGSELAGANQYKSAIPYFDTVLEYSSKDIDALYNRGICYLKTDDLKKACLDWIAISNLGKPDADKLLTKYCTEQDPKTLKTFIEPLLTNQNFAIWDETFNKVMEFNKIGVYRSGVRTL